MNNEFLKKYIKYFVLVGSVLFFSFLIYSLVFSGLNVVDPASNKLDADSNAGKTYSLLYGQGALYENILNNDSNLSVIQEDLALFARTTRPEFTDQDVLLGFTFEDSFTQSENMFTHYGYFYGLKDRIELKVTVMDRGIITLSITNTEDDTNIDDSLQLNGVVNELLVKLPINEDFYAIRYLNSQDEIVVGFFLGYTLEDVKKVEAILTSSLDDEYKTANIVYSVNSVGIFTLEGLKKFATSPENSY